MYDNGKPAVKASRLDDVLVTERGAKFVRCPNKKCARLCRVRRGLIEQHAPGEGLAGITDCPCAFQRIEFDLDPEQVAELHLGALAEAGARRPTRVHPRPRPAPAPPIAHMKRERTPHRNQTAGWSQADAERWARA